MNHEQSKKIIDEYADGRLSPDEAAEVEKHIDECRECGEIAAELGSLLGLIKQLPEKITPPRDLWKDIFHQIHDLKVVQIKKEEVEQPAEEEPDKAEEKQKEENRKEQARAKEKKERKKEKEEKKKEKHSKPARVYTANEIFKKYKTALIVAASILLLAVIFFLVKNISGVSWEIAGSPGLYRINNEVTAATELNDGDIFETLNSAAGIIIPETGRIQADQNSRIEKSGGKSLKLLTGGISVESQHSTGFRADVLSSEIIQTEPLSHYKVKFAGDNTAGLQVLNGKVLIQSGSLRSVVVPGFICTITGAGPEVPINPGANEELKTALKRLSFTDDPVSLNMALNESGRADALSLWHLFKRIHGDNIDEVFVKLYSLVIPPKGVDQESILRLKEEALNSWLEKIIASM